MESMSGRSALIAANGQKSALAELARSELRGEADRARAILLSLAGWTGPEIAEAFGVTADSVRHWRQWFAEGGVEALRSILASGPSEEKGQQALAVASAVPCEPVDRIPLEDLMRDDKVAMPRVCGELIFDPGLNIIDRFIL